MSAEPLIKDIVTVDDQGRILIPRSIRKKAGIEENAELEARLIMSQKWGWRIVLSPILERSETNV